jgi:ubiquinone/menaquinone biosynthesis C-methylase UbiE
MFLMFQNQNTTSFQMAKKIKKGFNLFASFLLWPIVVPCAYLFYRFNNTPITYVSPKVYGISMSIRHGGWYRERLSKTLGLLDLKPGLKVLEVGCGYGRFSKKLLENGADLTAIDIDDYCIETLSKEHGEIFQKGDVGSLEFKDESFDRIVMFDVLHHVKGSERAIKEAYRVLKPSGYAIIWEGSEPFVEDFLPPKMNSFLVKILDGEEVHDPEIIKHTKGYDLQELEEYCYKLIKPAN